MAKKPKIPETPGWPTDIYIDEAATIPRDFMPRTAREERDWWHGYDFVEHHLEHEMRRMDSRQTVSPEEIRRMTVRAADEVIDNTRPRVRQDRDVRYNHIHIAVDFGRDDSMTFHRQIEDDYIGRRERPGFMEHVVEATVREATDRARETLRTRIESDLQRHLARQPRALAPPAFRDEIRPLPTTTSSEAPLQVFNLATVREALNALQAHHARQLETPDVRGGMWRDARDRIYEGFRHHVVDGAAGFNGPRSKPDKAEPVAWLAKAGIPPVITLGRFTARLLDDTMKIWEESENLRHCLFKSYTARILRGDYIVYHVEARHLANNGFTLGFEKRGKSGASAFEISQRYMEHMMGHAHIRNEMIVRIEQEVCPPLTIGIGYAPGDGADALAYAAGAASTSAKPKEEAPQWSFDQCKCRGNQTNKGAELKAFGEFVLAEVLKVVQSEKPVDKSATEKTP